MSTHRVETCLSLNSSPPESSTSRAVSGQPGIFGDSHRTLSRCLFGQRLRRMSTRNTVGKKRIAVITSSRADYGYLRPIIRALSDAREFDMQLIVSGSHLSTAHGFTVRDVD